VAERDVTVRPGTTGLLPAPIASSTVRRPLLARFASAVTSNSDRSSTVPT
jgi:hypothetical protein